MTNTANGTKSQPRLNSALLKNGTASEVRERAARQHHHGDGAERADHDLGQELRRGPARRATSAG